LRIAVVCAQFPTASETFVSAQVIGLLNRGHDVEVFSDRPHFNDAIQSDVVASKLIAKTTYFTSPSTRLWKQITKVAIELARIAFKRPKSLPRALREVRNAFQSDNPRRFFDAAAFWRHEPFDILLCHFGQVGNRIGDLVDAGLVTGKLAVIFHGADVSVFVSQRGSTVYDRLFQICDLFLPVSQHWATELEKLGCPRDRIVVHHMGVDLAALTYVERIPIEPNDSTPVHLLSVCRLVEKKGLEFAIRALKEAQPFLARPIQYDIVGEGPLREVIEALIDQQGLTSVVRLKGWQDHSQINRLLCSSHLFVAPSVTAANGDQEGIPVAIMEAMAVGLPVLSTRHSGISELVAHGTSGLLSPERDVEALAQCLIILINETHHWPMMGRAGRSIVEKDFDQSLLNLRLEALLVRLASDDGRNLVPHDVVRAR
jgi:colanic acid/amylovoran biosynthesis glycosyltransferase